jgi:DNA relaxase NicK
VGRLRFGRRNGDALLQLSGNLADDYLDTLVPLAERISRIDIAVTARLPASDTLVAENHYAEACVWRDEHPTSALPTLVVNGDGGATCYVGRRTSDRLLRVYNKEAEQLASGDVDGSAHYLHCWRYELESKGTAAAPLAAALVRAADRPDFIQQSVHNYCELHGLGPIFPGRGKRLLLPGFRRRSDTESRLAWFRGAVAPAILRMTGEVDRADILEALGLGGSPEGDGGGG